MCLWRRWGGKEDDREGMNVFMAEMGWKRRRQRGDECVYGGDGVKKKMTERG